MDLALEVAKEYSLSKAASLQWTLSSLFSEEIVKYLAESEYASSIYMGGDYVISSFLGFDYKLMPLPEIIMFGQEVEKLLEDIKISIAGIKSIKKLNACLLEEASIEEYLVATSLEGINTSFAVRLISNQGERNLDKGRNVGLKGYTGINIIEGVASLYIEEVLVDKLRYIMSRGELINNMKDYYDILRILKGYNLDGRRLRECIELYGINVEELLDFFDYMKDNKNLFKRWKAWSRDNHLELVAFIQLADTLHKVFDPLADSLRDQKSFFGEWMPELVRYLD